MNYNILKKDRLISELKSLERERHKLLEEKQKAENDFNQLAEFFGEVCIAVKYLGITDEQLLIAIKAVRAEEQEATA